MPREDAKRLVERGYDQIAEAYLASKEGYDPETYAWVERLITMLPTGAAVLDLGCGAGVPVARRLAEQFTVTGVDISARQLELARRHVPTGRFLQADMAAVDFPPGAFDAVVSCYAIIHVPRDEQAALVGRICSWLSPGGSFLATWAVEEWEGTEEFCGATMWWSIYGAERNLEMLREAGFEIVSAEPETSNDETWLWVVARRHDGDCRRIAQ